MSVVRHPRSFSTTNQIWGMVTDAAKKNGKSQSAIVNEALERYLLATKIDRGDWDTATDDDGYDPRLFYTASQDSKGHSSKLVANVPKNLAGLLSRVISAGAVPEYRSLQDFLRDAFTHRAHQVAKWIDEGELAREVTVSMMLAEEEQIAQRHRDMTSLIDSVKENLEKALRRQQYAWILNHVKDRLEKVHSVDESYQETYAEMLRDFAGKAKAAMREGKGYLKVVGNDDELAPPRRRGRPPKNS